MLHFGYALTSDKDTLDSIRVGRRDQLGIQTQEALMRLQLEGVLLGAIGNHWRRWRRDATARWFAWQH